MIAAKIQPSSPGGKAFFYLLFALTLQTGLSALTSGEGLEAVVVQFEMEGAMVGSEEAYAGALADAVETAMAGGEADLLIFPEYLGVFSALIPWYGYLASGESFEQVWGRITYDHPGIGSIRELLSLEEERNNAFLDRIWGDLARKHNVFILSGSRFTLSPDGDKIFNTAVVYGPDGELFYRQNKYFLTDFETDILGLDSGDPLECPGFMVKDRLIRLTICRDTFLRDWETLYTDGYLWIDIKANGVPFTRDQAELFTRALPARLARTDIPWGVTACLTGDFLDLLWEGESNILYNNRSKVVYRARSSRSDGFEIMRYLFP